MNSRGRPRPHPGRLREAVGTRSSFPASAVRGALEQGDIEPGKAHLQKAAATFSKIESKAGERTKRTIGELP